MMSNRNEENNRRKLEKKFKLTRNLLLKFEND